MSKTKNRWCKACDRNLPHDKVGTYDGYGNSALWIDHLLYRGDIEEVWKCQRCGKKSSIRKY